MSTQAKQVDTGWPSSQPLWSWGAVCVAVLLFVGLCWVQYAFTWSALERYYAPSYAKTGFRGWQSAHNHANYKVLYLVDKRGQQRLALPEEIETTKRPDGKIGYLLTDTALAEGLVRPTFDVQSCSDQTLHAWQARWIYKNRTLWGFVKQPAYTALGIFVVLLYFAGRKDRERSLALLRGQRLSGTEVVTSAGFNRRMRRRKRVNGPLLDGVIFVDGARSWLAHQLNWPIRGVYVPREREQQHIVMMGDTGSGKTAAIRQVLLQVEERGELAIVYDPTGEYVQQFYDPARGDIILNPLDARCPFYNLSDEIGDDAEALTLAASLFPDREHENTFFTDAPRRIIAYLLCLRPTPDELVQWLMHPAEIDRRVRGTELETMIAADAPAQRKGVLASLNMIADALKLLPRENEVKGRFSTMAWATERKGWIFITSTPETRVPLRPLTSLWIDLLVLRLMSMGAASGHKTFFAIDEMHSLQRLPNLATMGLTETRRANVVMMLGFQGRAQIVDLYGPLAEALLSQPATKLFFKTSDPDAADWISRAIGAVKYLRCRVSRSQQSQGRDMESQQRDTVSEPLVMGSEVMGLEPLEVYFKHGRYTVHLSIKYIELPLRQPAFMPRNRTSVRMMLEAGQAPQSSSASTSSGRQLVPQSSTHLQQGFVE